MLSIAMIHPLVMLVVVTTLYQKRGGHCFFIFKSGVILENIRFLITNGVSDLTLPRVIMWKQYEIIEGTVKEVRASKIRRQCCEIVLEDEKGRERRYLVSTLALIKGLEKYRNYWCRQEVLEAERLGP